MKITEIIQFKPSSAIKENKAQDIVAQDIVSETCVSAIAEGVSQILRRVKGKGVKPGFRCTSGPRKGRIVSKASTCFMRRDPVKGTKISKKRLQRAASAGKKMAVTKRSGGVSRRLKGTQIKTKKSGKGGKASRPIRSFAKPFIKSKIVKPKK